MNASRNPRPLGAAARAAVLAAFLAAGCAAPRLAPVDLSEPGWSVAESAAVWKPRGDAPELAGELLVASHPDGRQFVQFSKQSLPVVSAVAAPAGWSIASPLRRGAVGGRGRPADRVPWFQFRSIPPGAPPSPRWRLERDDAGWTLRAARGGEFVGGPNP